MQPVLKENNKTPLSLVCGARIQKQTDRTVSVIIGLPRLSPVSCDGGSLCATPLMSPAEGLVLVLPFPF